MNISKQIRAYRKKNKISQEDLAEQLFVSRQTISSWERGITYPDLRSLLMLSDYFNISLDHLVRGDIEKMENKLEIAKLKKLSIIGNFMVLTIGFSILALLLDYFTSLFIGLILIGLVALVFVIRARNNIISKKDFKTYRELIAYLEGRDIDSLESEDVLVRKTIVKIIIITIIGSIL